MSRWDDITGELTGVSIRPSGLVQDGFERNRPYLVVLSGGSMGQMFLLDGPELVIGRSSRADIQLMDEGISRRHTSVFARDDDGGQFWIRDLDSRNGTFCNGRRVREQPLHDGDKIQLGRGVMLRFCFQDKFDETFQRLMQESALRDGLTHAYNKRYFTERLESELRFAQRHEEPLSLLLMDLDHFKQINDRYGHLAGDQALRSFAYAIQRSIRNEDVFARYGGEEFAVISRSISMKHTRLVAERLRALVEKLVIEHRGRRIGLTMSVGVAALPDVQAATPHDLIDAADRALYWAKTHGRNQVVVYRPGLDARPDPDRDDAGAGLAAAGDITATGITPYTGPDDDPDGGGGDGGGNDGGGSAS